TIYAPDNCDLVRWGYANLCWGGRCALAWMDPTITDPVYENFDRIQPGMIRSEAHALMGCPPTKVGRWWNFKAHIQDEWEGTRGVIVVRYYARGFTDAEQTVWERSMRPIAKAPR